MVFAGRGCPTRSLIEALRTPHSLREVHLQCILVIQQPFAHVLDGLCLEDIFNNATIDPAKKELDDDVDLVVVLEFFEFLDSVVQPSSQTL